MINKEVVATKWNPVVVGNKGTQVSHLLFADGMLLFAKASMRQIKVVTKCLDAFCVMSGQKVSVNKIKIMFSNNVENNLAKSISEWNGYFKSNNLGKYLGVSLLHNRISFSTYNYLLEKVQYRLSGWTLDMLSMAGRVTFCKFVISVLLICTMQSTTLPKTICKEIEKLCRRFVWGDTDSSRRVHLIN